MEILRLALRMTRIRGVIRLIHIAIPDPLLFVISTVPLSHCDRTPLSFRPKWRNLPTLPRFKPQVTAQFSGPTGSVSKYHILLTCQAFEADRTPYMEFVGADSYFRSQAVFETIGKLG